MPPIAINTGEAMKGKKTITSLHDAADTELARAQIEADRVFKIINENLNNLKGGAADYQFLFTDAKELVQKDAESVLAVIDQRITKHKADEQAKALAAAERECRAKTEVEEAKVPLEPALSAPTGLMRPSDSAMVYVIGRFYRVPTKTAVEWLKGIDFDNLDL
jgi:hypothetical protein